MSFTADLIRDCVTRASPTTTKAVSIPNSIPTVESSASEKPRWKLPERAGDELREKLNCRAIPALFPAPPRPATLTTVDALPNRSISYVRNRADRGCDKLPYRSGRNHAALRAV